jgi:DivIVA domain-containing protein
MIDLTPLDVRNKRGDFKRILRGYEPQEVDTFLELVAERLEALVRENLLMKERTQILQVQVDSQSGREHAVQEALVTAQELRTDIREQARRESEHLLKEAEAEARRLITEAEAEVRTRLRNTERLFDEGQASLAELERRRIRFLRSFRKLLDREMDVVDVEESKTPLEERTIDLELGTQRADEEPLAQVEPPAQERPLAADVAVEDLAPEPSAALIGQAEPVAPPAPPAAPPATLFSDEPVQEPIVKDRDDRRESLLLYLDGDENDARTG